ncbi:uncharacterized protein UTRI_05380_B [Ustilago trichophora]|uniref:Uncharacterized protein n=1 Tax=Ustilago trichophora TaxID=86804 RepID=A0A5C3EK12_9BASI|nr:uncharacterized protein UTRI_05380_B [Ustilago trichophora]
MWSPLASASLVFLLLYLILFIILCTLFALRRVQWKSRWLILLLHVLVRLASQACGLSFGLIGYRNIDLLVAYYVLGAEGYFTLVVCTARFLIAWQRNHWNGYSWIEPIDPTKERAGWRKRFKRLLQGKPSEDSLAAKLVVVVDWLLVAANTIIVTGGSLSSAAYSNSSGLTQMQRQARLDASKGMRAAGQAVFLVVNTMLLVSIAVTIHQHRHFRFDHHPIRNAEGESPRQEKVAQDSANENKSRPWYAHPTLLLLLLTWPFLAVRGGFGVAQALLPDLNYFNSEVYDANNLTAQFVTEESCFVTMMEFISAAILTATYWTIPRQHRSSTVNSCTSSV